MNSYSCEYLTGKLERGEKWVCGMGVWDLGWHEMSMYLFYGRKEGKYVPERERNEKKVEKKRVVPHMHGSTDSGGTVQ